MVKWVVKCTKACGEKFTLGGYYAVNTDGTMIDNNGNGANNQKTTKTFWEWYNTCNWNRYAFDLVHEYTPTVCVTHNEMLEILSKELKVPKDYLSIMPKER